MQLRAIVLYGALSAAFAATPALAQNRGVVPGGRDSLGRDTINVINDTTTNRGPSVACDSGRVSPTMPPTTGTGTVSPQPCGTIIRDTVSGTVMDTTSVAHPVAPDKPASGSVIPTQPHARGATGNPPTGGTVSSPPPTTPR